MASPIPSAATETIQHPTSPLVGEYPRRQFLTLATGCLLCGAAGVSPAQAAGDRAVDVGTLADYPRDEISEKFIQHDFFLIRHQGRLFAATAICPHKKNLLLRSPQNAALIICSGHDSSFGPDGVPLGGPARRGLARFAISTNAASHILVDTTRTFRQEQWDNPASYVPVSPATP